MTGDNFSLEPISQLFLRSLNEGDNFSLEPVSKLLSCRVLLDNNKPFYFRFVCFVVVVVVVVFGGGGAVVVVSFYHRCLGFPSRPVLLCVSFFVVFTLITEEMPWSSLFFPT